jgi:DNA ligase (NAD+)
MVSKGILSSFADLFTLDPETVEGLDRMGAKSAQNLIQAIEAGKEIPLHRFLYALGIRHVGEHVAKILADRFGRLDKLMTASPEDLTSTEGIGPIVADSIVAFFRRSANRKIVQRILDEGVEIRSESADTSGALSGKRFVLTGSLPNLSRQQATALIEGAGGKVQSSVSRNVDYVVAGEAPGSKLRRAEELGVAIIDEAELKKLVG